LELKEERRREERVKVKGREQERRGSIASHSETTADMGKRK